jgi:hypothetical protein
VGSFECVTDLSLASWILSDRRLALPNDVLAGSVMLNTSFTAVSGLRKMMDSAFPSYRVPVTHEVCRHIDEPRQHSLRKLGSLPMAVRPCEFLAVHMDLTGPQRYGTHGSKHTFYFDSRYDQCYAHPNSDTRNTFHVATGAPKLAELTGRRDVPYRRLTNLTLWPAAHALPLLEHIVLTALIVERRRLSEMVVAQMRAAMTRIVTY